MTCLDKMKSEAWRLTALWKDKHKEAHLFKKLWKLQTLVKKLRTTWILRKDSPTHPFTSLEAELREAAAENWDNPPKGQKWRLKIIPQMIKVNLSQISSLEQQLGVFLDNHLILTRSPPPRWKEWLLMASCLVTHLLWEKLLKAFGVISWELNVLIISKPLMNFLTTTPSAFQTLKIIQ